MRNTVLITGTNRGIGLEFARQYAQKHWRVIATCREPDKATKLHDLAARYSEIKILKLDITDENEVDRLQNYLNEKKINIDLLINNAGILGASRAPGQIDPDDINHVFGVNVVSPLKLTEKLLPFIRTSQYQTIASLTSKMGSIDQNRDGGYYSYRLSKAGLNMAMKNFAIDNPDLNILLFHPGWVKTEMGGIDASITPNESVKGMIEIIEENLAKKNQASFFDYKGRIIPW